MTTVNQTTGKKFDQDKPRMGLLPSLALEEVAKVLTFGAKKYAPWNWVGGIAYERLIGAALRHLGKFQRGEDLDDETNISHLAHATCCLLFLLEFQLRGHTELDDRHKWEAK